MLFERVQLEPGEAVLQVVRKHWFIITIELLSVLAMIIVPFAIIISYNFLPSTLTLADISLSDYTGYIVFGFACWMLFSLLTGFTIWTHYYLDLWVITDRRIILVDQISFFNRNVSIFRLERLQDIEFKINGIIPTLLNYGTLQAQTAGAHESNFATKGLPDPRGLQATIQKAMDERLRVLHIAPDQVVH